MAKVIVTNNNYVLPVWDDCGTYKKDVVPIGCNLHDNCFLCTESDCTFTEWKQKKIRESKKEVAVK